MVDHEMVDCEMIDCEMVVDCETDLLWDGRWDDMVDEMRWDGFNYNWSTMSSHNLPSPNSFEVTLTFAMIELFIMRWDGRLWDKDHKRW